MGKILVICVLVCLCFSINSFAQDFVVGEVVEYVPENRLIQVCDSIYKAEQLYSDDGVNTIATVPFSSVKSRSVVQIFPLTKEENYWSTEKVLILTGSKKEQFLKEYGVECSRRTNQTGRQDD